MGLLDKIFGTPAEDEEYLDFEDSESYDVSSSAVTEEEAGYGSSFSAPVSNFGGSKAINIHGGTMPSKITVMKPTSFAEMMEEAIASLREGTIIFMNLTQTSTEHGARIVDFMTGAVAMCDGRIERVDARCYVIAPKNVEWLKTIED